MNSALSEAAAHPDFADSGRAGVLLDRYLAIFAASRSYLEATGRDLDELVGRHMFDAFPDNPDDPRADGVANLSDSLERVMRSGRSHNMIVQRYDVASRHHGGQFVEKTWIPVNRPLHDRRGRVIGVYHHVEDVTELGLLARTPAPLLSERGQVQLRRLMDAIHEQRLETRALCEHDHHLHRALSAAIAGRHPRTPASTAARRRELWEHVSLDSRPTGTAPWSEALCRVVQQQIPHASAATVSLGLVPDVRQLVAMSRPWAEALDEAEFVLGEGPLTAAMDSGAPVVISDLGTQSARWPAYEQAARQLGVTGAAVFPLGVAFAPPIGTLGIYSRHGQALSPAEIIDATLLSELASTIIITDLDQVVATDSDKLGHTDGDRLSIAVGMTAAQLHISTGEALTRLRAYTFTSGRPLQSVIDDIINRTLALD